MKMFLQYCLDLMYVGPIITTIDIRTGVLLYNKIRLIIYRIQYIVPGVLTDTGLTVGVFTCSWCFDWMWFKQRCIVLGQ